jgi:hypothetical protein
MSRDATLAERVFDRIAAHWLRRADDLAVVARTGYSFEEWANWEAIFACRDEPTWVATPRPRYADLGAKDSALFGDLLVSEADRRVLVEVGTVHDWTQSKWKHKLNVDTDKLRDLDGHDVARLQIIARLASGRWSVNEASWLKWVDAWTVSEAIVRHADLPGGGRVEVRG